jgi:hypothetical protein
MCKNNLLFDGRVTYCLNVKNNNDSPIFQLFFTEGMDMTTNISEVSANPMATITQQAPGVTIAPFISKTSSIIIASAIPDGIQHDSAISAQSSTIPVGSAISEATPVPSCILEASVVPPPISPCFTPAAPTVLIPIAPIPSPVPGQTIVSPAWLEDQLRYMVAMKSPSCVPPETLITPEIKPVFLHVSYFFYSFVLQYEKIVLCIMVNC